MDIQKHRDNCLKENILPLQENDKKIFEVLDKMNAKLDVVMPTIVEINELRASWKVAGEVSNWVVKFVIGIGVIITAIYAVKEWIKK